MRTKWCRASKIVTRKISFYPIKFSWINWGLISELFINFFLIFLRILLKSIVRLIKVMRLWNKWYLYKWILYRGVVPTALWITSFQIWLNFIKRHVRFPVFQCLSIELFLFNKILRKKSCYANILMPMERKQWA